MENHTGRLTRRHLVQAAAAIPFAAVRGSAANSAVTVALIGTGGRGGSLASRLVKDKRARLVALCDVFDSQIEKAKKRIPIDDVKVYNDYRKVLESDVDAVMIATPVYLHPEHLEAAIQAGKHVYVEKPGGVDVAGCKRVMKASDSAPRHLNITFGFQQRYSPLYQKGKKMIDEGGPIRQAEAHFLKSQFTGKEPDSPKPTGDLDKVRQWKWWRHLYGGIIVETQCHSIDALNWYMDGHPTKAVGSAGRTLIKTGDMNDHIAVTYDYANNVQATLSGSSITTPFFREVYERFHGETVAVEIARNYLKYYPARKGADPVRETPPRSIDAISVEAFITRVLEGKPENVGVRGAESTLTAIMGRMAADARREVTWDEMMKSG
jgi:predicted dehydrogenase